MSFSAASTLSLRTVLRIRFSVVSNPALIWYSSGIGYFGYETTVSLMNASLFGADHFNVTASAEVTASAAARSGVTDAVPPPNISSALARSTSMMPPPPPLAAFGPNCSIAPPAPPTKSFNASASSNNLCNSGGKSFQLTVPSSATLPAAANPSSNCSSNSSIRRYASTSGVPSGTVKRPSLTDTCGACLLGGNFGTICETVDPSSPIENNPTGRRPLIGRTIRFKLGANHHPGSLNSAF